MGWGFMAKAPDLTKFEQIPVRKSSVPVEPYKPKFLALVEELKSRSDEFELEVCELRESTVTTEQLEGGRKRFRTIDDHMAQFYSEFDSIEIRWNGKGDVGGSGCINILPLPKVFSNWEGNVWFDEDDPNRFVVPFDYFVDEAGCGLKLPSELPEDESANLSCPVVFFSCSSTGHRELNLTFGSYMELLLKSRGFFYWPSAIAADQDAKECTTEPRNFRKAISSGLFPNTTVSDFLQRHEELLAADAAEEEKENGVLNSTKKALEGIECNMYQEHGYVWIELDASNNNNNLAKAADVIKKEFDVDISDLEPGSMRMTGGRAYKLK